MGRIILIFVGAMLFSGSYLFNTASKNVDSSIIAIDSMSTSAYNQQLLGYCGIQLSSSRVKALNCIS